MIALFPLSGALVKLVAAGTIATLALMGCSSFRASDNRVLENLADAPGEPTVRSVSVDDWTIRLLEAGDPRHPQVVFIHGAPGSLDAFEPYFRVPELLKAAHLVSVDRPGYGFSDHGRIVTSIRRQAELLRPLVRPGAILVGHSYGATTAVRFAMEYPELVGGLVLVAGSLSPDDERIFFFNRPLERRVLNWMLSRDWRVANAEKVTRVAELTEMIPLWQRVTAPVAIIHGTDDSLVPYPHAEFARERLVNAPVTFVPLEGASHFILWQEVDLITATILDLISGS